MNEKYRTVENTTENCLANERIKMLAINHYSFIRTNLAKNICETQHKRQPRDCRLCVQIIYWKLHRNQSTYFFAAYEAQKVARFVHIEHDDRQSVFFAKCEGCHVHYV